MLQELAVSFDAADTSRCGLISTEEAWRITQDMCAQHADRQVSLPALEGASISFTGLIEQLNLAPWCDALPQPVLTAVRRRANQFTAVGDSPAPSPSRTPVRSPFKKVGQGNRPIVHVFRNDGGRRRTGHVEILLYSIPHLLEVATQKLGLSRCARRAFDMEGKELTEHKSIVNGQELVVSSGEGFQRRPPDANKIHKLLMNSEYATCVMQVDNAALSKKIKKYMSITAINGQSVRGLNFFQTMQSLPDARPLELQLRSLSGKEVTHTFNTPGTLQVEFVDRLYLLKTGLEVQWRTETSMQKPDALPVRSPSHGIKWVSEGRNRCVVLFPNDQGSCYDHITAVAPSMPVLLALASKKLGLPWGAQRVFRQDGTEVTEAAWEDIHSGDELVFSCGEAFKPRDNMVRHSKFGSLCFSVDRLDMMPSERNSLNPIVAEGYQHTRTAPFCRTRKPAERKPKNLGFEATTLVRNVKKTSGSPPKACRFRDIPDANALADDVVGLLATRGVCAQPGSPVRQMLGAHRHMEEEAQPASDTNLPWSDEMGQMEVLTGHYHELLRRQKDRSQLENYLQPTLLRGKFDDLEQEYE
eukprot:TRINITY_DN2126_c0_g1_i4.p1 TRINITY_DN2126_c0_g1~~TRINITY_DN2126_c0_g1_i4.p1  ORF type:complete len:585 (+),score=117.91 TRINITY_DN2126_c0_g1_i4:250-2004(+)